MLKDMDAAATVAVSDLERARGFYGGTLGLPLAGEEVPGVLTYRSGGSRIVVYESEYAGTGRATSVTWGVGDELDEIVRRLRSAGVTFEHYDDLPGLTIEGDVHVAGDFKAVWLKDPDGNILHLNNM